MILVLLFLLCSCTDSYKVLETYGEKSVKIPMLSEGYVPQGICVYKNCFLFSLYSDSEPSLIVATDAENGDIIGKATLRDSAGKYISDHANAIAFDGKNFYYAHKKGVFKASESEMLKALSNGSLILEKKDYINFGINVSYMSCFNGLLLAGEFTNSGRQARAYGYKLKEGKEPFNYTDKNIPLPDIVFFVPDKVQGMTFLNERQAVICTSYGRTGKSALCFFDIANSGESVNFGQYSIPSCTVEKTNDESTLVFIPPMAENICVKGSKIFILFESGALKYELGVIDKMVCVYMFDYEKFKAVKDKTGVKSGMNENNFVTR